MNENASSDKLPFAEYAALEAERGAKQHGQIGTPKLSFQELVASDLTFDEIEAEYGEETAINVGIAKDPDAPELTEEDWARARPVAEVDPELVGSSRPGLKPTPISPTDEEEAEIQRQIAKDPDAPEWTEEDWARAKPAIEVHPELVEWSLRRRGKQKAPTKELISIRLDSDITDYFRAGGPGWQTRLNDTLRRAVFGS